MNIIAPVEHYEIGRTYLVCNQCLELFQEFVFVVIAADEYHPWITIIYLTVFLAPVVSCYFLGKKRSKAVI